ncbi:GAF and ANTAR domain-containing protein [Nocardia anaemiae]|uniref:GAF and ANTAR domain-containing protein n=1 Tax=Nocardia anaemiae TaxID=263910 RepID=UPI0007A4A4D6|nr:GAF and ANTAR domain-containing protein [Nocardia anaemiae]
MAPPFDDRQHDRSSEPLPDSIQLLRSLVRAVDSLASDFDVVELCQQLLEACTDVTDASDAGLLLADQRGELQVLASTNESSRLLGLLQHEGPGLDAYRSSTAVSVPDLSAAGDLWPEFAHTASAAGYRCACAVPLRLHRDSIGALTVLADSAAPLGQLDLRIGQILADIAAVGIAHHVLRAQGTTIQAQLPTALNTRVAIEQAKGVLAERGDRDMDRAFQIMRDYARATGRRLTDIAGDIVEGRIDLRADATD